MPLPNPFEEMGKKPSPVVHISEFATAAWREQVLRHDPSWPMRKQAIDIWWFACDEWLKEVHNEPWMQWPTSSK